MTRDTKARKPRVVARETGAGEVTRMMLPPRGIIEVRERQDYSWKVLYPDEGFIPCPPVCALKHSHDYKQKMVETFYQPTDQDDAMAWAQMLAEEREIKVFPYQGIRKPRAAVEDQD